VAQLANRIEEIYPGHVRGVDVEIRDPSGRILTDLDISLRNANIEVKSGRNLSGLGSQVRMQSELTGLPTIVYAPNAGIHAFRGYERQGMLITRDPNLLLELIKP
jgi:hypothetical protein